MGVIYLIISFMFVFAAIHRVNDVGWDFWTFLLIAVASIDILIAIRYFKAPKAESE
ncbi:YdiK family protein [Bacillus alkalicellulosilyticus]|uniref:YdiK family protein n=1 Tax=Alkalihalobacterium alkalicellulosilyticum TaxID=1912214 RepID=UPI00099676D6|nr:YdiK family protein [Bacillus alkalicellulosilyticus]